MIAYLLAGLSIAPRTPSCERQKYPAHREAHVRRTGARELRKMIAELEHELATVAFLDPPRGKS